MDVEQFFERFVDSIADTDPSREEHRRQLRTQVLAIVESATTLKPKVLDRDTRRWNMGSALTRWSAAAAVVLAGGIAVWLYMGSSPAVAWAAVGENLNRVQTLSWKVAVYQGKERREEQTLDLFADRVKVTSKDSIMIFDVSSGKSLLLLPKEQQALIFAQDDYKNGLRRNWLADLKKIVGHKEAKEIGTKTIEGQSCMGWQVVCSEGIVTVWANEKTAEMVLVEIERGIVRTVMSNFRFNCKLDESQFSLDLPEGYTAVVNTNYAAKDVVEDDLLLLLRAWAGGNGGVFPNSLTDVGGWFKAASKYNWSMEKQDEDTMTKAISRAFFRLGSKQDWVYRGKGVKLGNAKEAIFWTPARNGKYDVIYGDLSIRQVDKKDLP
jgi:outer membrane lipoprotein-sorting protein